jgi:DNA-binding winged helix-turn-helix (wHTH) protein/tetratricopeptide (TPR) repeat protein
MNGVFYTFGPFQLSPCEHILLRDGVSIPLSPKTFDLLVTLVSRRGQLLTRDELMHAIWPDSFVEEINLTVNISLLRKTLGEQQDGRQYIATIPKRGYRFDAEVIEHGKVAEPAMKVAEDHREPPTPVAGATSTVPPVSIPDSKRPGRKWLAISAAIFVVAAASWIVYRTTVAHRNASAILSTQPRVVGQEANSQALELYNQGRSSLSRRTAESVQQSIDLFNQALAIDPQYVAAYAGLADAYILAGSYGNSFLSPQTAMPKAKNAAEKALALDSASAEAHTSLAYIKLTYDWDWAGAETEFKRALELNPDYINALHWYSHELMAEGRVQESHQLSEEALALDPTNVLMNEHMAWHHLMAREYDRSIPQALKTIELDPDFVQAHRVLALDYLYTGQFNKACAEFQKGVTLSHDDPIARAYLARCYALSHHPADARKILDALVKASVERYISSAEIAAVYAALGDDKDCLDWLTKACSERASALIYINIDPVYDHMRRNPAFQNIVRCVHLLPLVDETQVK